MIRKNAGNGICWERSRLAGSSANTLCIQHSSALKLFYSSFYSSRCRCGHKWQGCKWCQVVVRFIKIVLTRKSQLFGSSGYQRSEAFYNINRQGIWVVWLNVEACDDFGHCRRWKNEDMMEFWRKCWDEMSWRTCCSFCWKLWLLLVWL